MMTQSKNKFYFISSITILLYFVIGGFINYIPLKYYHLESCNSYDNKPIQETIYFFEGKNMFTQQQMSINAFRCDNKNLSPILLHYPFLPKEVVNPYSVYFIPSISPGGKFEDTNVKLSKMFDKPEFNLHPSNQISPIDQNGEIERTPAMFKQRELLYAEFSNYWTDIIEKDLNVKMKKPVLIMEDPYDIHRWNFFFTFGLVILLLIYIRKKIYKT